MSIKVPISIKNFRAPGINSGALELALQRGAQAAGIQINPADMKRVAQAASQPLLGGAPDISNVPFQGMCYSGRDNLFKRPILPLRLQDTGTAGAGVSVASTADIVAAIKTSTTWVQGGTTTGTQATKANRELLAEDKGHSLFSAVDGKYIRYIRPYVTVLARRASESFDPDLSAMIARMLMSQLFLVLDPDDTAKNVSLDAMPFGSFPEEGAALKPDQVKGKKFTRNSVLRIDWAGQNEASDYDAMALVAGTQLFIHTVIGADIVVTPTEDEDFTEVF